MANNPIPANYESLIHLLHDAINGARIHGKSIKLKQNDDLALQSCLEALVGEPGTGDIGLKAKSNAAKSDKTAKTAELRRVQSAGKVLASACINTLKLRLGTQWNSAWREAGFNAGSLQIPAHPMALLQELASYYLAHPDHEVGSLTPEISCTADACNHAVHAIDAAQADSNQSITAANAAQNALAEGMDAARTRLMGLKHELKQLIGEEDGRWYAFGFNQPVDPHTPDVPVHIVVTAGAEGMILVDWDDARRAEGYRVLLKDADGKPVDEKLVHDSETKFTDLTAGQTLQVTVSARNAAGESKPSEAVSVVVP